MKAHLAIVLAVSSLTLAAAPVALADNPPTPLMPDDAASFTARADQIIFQASTTAIPSPSRIDFYISKDNQTDSDGVLSNQIDLIHAGPDSVLPGVYGASPGSDETWPRKPGTYYWQAVYYDCTQGGADCFNEGPVRTLTLDPLPPPTQTSPSDGATIPYGGQKTFSVRDAPAYTQDGTRLYIEFARGNDLDPDGTFAAPDHYFFARPLSAGGGTYEYQFSQPFSRTPGTYYWIVQRFDCSAEPDCYVTNNQVRSFTVAPPVAGSAPNTRFTRHPGHRTHKRRAKFAFSSDLAGASFQCFYTGGWSRCRSPQRFRHLKPGRYRFKARAIANGRRDRTPAKWLFKVVH